MAQFISVNGFEKFQHYRDRKPPWIKLYRDLLSDDRLFDLSEADRFQLVGLFILASQHDNRIPNKPAWLRSELRINRSISLKTLMDTGWVSLVEHDASTALAASTPIAERKHETRAETETETETETEKKEPLAISSPVVPKYSDMFQGFWELSTRRGSKIDAYKEFQKIKPDVPMLENMLAAQKDWQQSDQWQDETKQPHICRWLKRRGWEEEVPKSNRINITLDASRHPDSGPHPRHRCEFCDNAHEWECEYLGLPLSCGSPHDSACPEFASRFNR